MCATLYAGGDALSVLCRLEAVDGRLCLQDVLELLELLEAMRVVLLCILEVAEGELCLLEVPEVIRCMLSVRWRLWRVGFVCWRREKCQK